MLGLAENVRATLRSVVVPLRALFHFCMQMGRSVSSMLRALA